MNKKLSPKILAFSVVLILLAGFSVPVFATNDSYSILIGGRKIYDGIVYSHESEGFGNIIESGQLEKSGTTLKLQGATLNGGNYNAIEFIEPTDNTPEPAFKIELSGGNYINSDKDGIKIAGNQSPLVITNQPGSNGGLSISSKWIGISADSLLIDNCSINFSMSSMSSLEIGSQGLSIKNSNVTTNSNICGISSLGIVNIENSTVSVNSVNNGIYSGNNVNISNSTVDIISSDFGISASGKITVNSGKLKAKVNTDDGAAILANDIGFGSGMGITTGGKIVYVSGFQETIAQNDSAHYVYIETGVELIGASKEIEISKVCSVDVKSDGTATPSLTLPSNIDVQNAVLTTAERAALANGANVGVQFIVSNAQPPQGISGYIGNSGYLMIGSPFDISIFKNVAGVQSQVTDLNNPIRLTFQIPDNSLGKAGYGVLREHNGDIAFLSDMDSNPNTISVDTDRCSTYVLVYKDSKSAKTSDNSNIISLTIMAVISVTAVAFIEKKKKEF